jgi:hypothetical protein
MYSNFEAAEQLIFPTNLPVFSLSKQITLWRTDGSPNMRSK